MRKLRQSERAVTHRVLLQEDMFLRNMELLHQNRLIHEGSAPIPPEPQHSLPA